MLSKRPELFLTDFLQTRGLSAPSRQPLFSYHMTLPEFEELKSIIIEHRPRGNISSPQFRHWNACFVLWGSEWYRREYTNDDGWQWDPLFEQLGFQLTTLERNDVVPLAFETYWKRPVRRYAERRNILGTVFIEGGLPYKLIAKGESKFSSIIQRTLIRYERLQYTHESLADYVAEQSTYLPKVFSEPESVNLITNIVETLVMLADRVDVESEILPSKQLDNSNPSWRSCFPLPLDTEDGKRIINSWLSKATEITSYQKRLGNILSCIHVFNSSFSKTETKVLLPKKLTIEGVHKDSLRSNRLELHLREGETDRQDLGTGFCKLNNNGIELNVRHRQTTLVRRATNEPLIIHVNSSGVKLHTFEIPGSSLVFENEPVGVVEEGGKYRVVGQGSFTTKIKEIILLLPQTANIKMLSGISEPFSIPNSPLNMLELCGDVRVLVNGQSYRVKTNSTFESSGGLIIKTASLPYLTRPSLVYKDIPEIADSTGLGNDYALFLSGTNVHNLEAYQKSGVHFFSARNNNGDTLLHRKVGLVPADFEILLQSDDCDARLQINCKANLLIDIHAEGCTIKKVSNHDGKEYLITPDSLPPKDINLEITPNLDSDPIFFTLPYPAEGVYAYDQDGVAIKSDTTIDRLIGSQLHLYSSKDYAQTFEIEIALAPIKTGSPKVVYKIPVNQKSKVISLYSYKQQILELMSLSEDIDAFVRLSVRLRQDMFVCNIRRFASSVILDRELKQISFDSSLLRKRDIHRPIAIRIAEPEQKEITFDSVLKGVELNHFSIPSALETEGPWMIVPHVDAEVDFRPNFYIKTDYSDSLQIVEDPRSIQAAIRAFHPKSNPNVIRDFLKKMANDFNHKGWGYIKSLWSKYGYLPMSTFAVWKPLVGDEETLILSLFVLDMDTSFIHKVDTEFPIHWEMIKISTWKKAIHLYTGFLVAKGIDEKIASSITESQLEKFNSHLAIIPDDILKYIVTNQSVPLYPIQIVKTWFDELIQTHADSDWPADHIGVFKQISESVRAIHPDLKIDIYHKWQLPIATYPIACAAIACELIRKEDFIRFTPAFNFECKELRTFEPEWFSGLYCYAFAAIQAKKGE